MAAGPVPVVVRSVSRPPPPSPHTKAGAGRPPPGPCPPLSTRVSTGARPPAPAWRSLSRAPGGAGREGVSSGLALPSRVCCRDR